MRSRQLILSTRLTESDHALVKDAAQRQGLNPSEFCRLAVLAAATRPHPILQTLIEEIVAVRYILNNITVYLTTTGKEVNAATISSIGALADAFKGEKTRRLLDSTTTQIPKQDA